MREPCPGKLGVRRLTGQVAFGCAKALHKVCTVAITAAVLVSVGLGAAAWRLSQAPWDLPWLTERLEAAVNTNGGPTRLSIGGVALAWEGFRRGVERSLELRVSNVLLTDQAGVRRMSVPRADVSVSLFELLLGRLAIRTVEVDDARLTIVRAADGTLNIDMGDLTEPDPNPSPDATPMADLLSELAQPARTDRDLTNTLMGQLREVRVRDARVTVIDRALGVTWRAPQAEIDLVRHPTGGLEGTAELSLALGDQRTHLSLAATLSPGGAGTHLRARMTPFTPSALARSSPSLSALSALDAPVSGQASLDLDGHLGLRRLQFDLHAAAGSAAIGKGKVLLSDAVLVGSATPDTVTVQTFRVTLPGRAAAPKTHLETHGTVQRSPDRISAAFSATLDQVEFADLPAFWPQGVGGNAREWLLENITAGTARDGHVEFGIEASPDLANVVLTRATGTLDGTQLQVHWLRPVPPIDHGRAQLRIIDPDTLDIVVAGGRQVLRSQKSNEAGMQIRSGRMRITGLMQPHQKGTIEADISTSLPDALALLREPRLRLLDRHPIDLKDPAGQGSVKLTVALPLDQNVSMDDVAIHARAHLGSFDLDADADGMKLNGKASLAAIPATIDATMDFRAGPPAQAVQTVTISGKTTAAQLASAGLDTTSVVSGPMELNATLTERRNGLGELAIASDLTAAELTVTALAWRKPGNAAAKASARLTLDHDRLARLDTVQVDGDGLTVRGRGTFNGGKLTEVQFDRLVLGRTSADAVVRLPASSSAPIMVICNGAVIDLAARLERSTPPHKPETTEPPRGPPWIVDAKFNRVLLARGATLGGVVLHAENDGRVFRQLRLEGQTSAQKPILLQIVPDGAGRRLAVSAADAGELLRGLDYVKTMQGGKLSIQGHFDDTQPRRPLIGTANLEDFRIQNAPALGKLLQAMTLYGLVEVMRGPGLGFTQMEAPFRLTDDSLAIDNARAFSSSLGLTAKGRIDLDAQVIEMEGTIVPAYFFNSLLGNIPLVGKLFSPEKGGGVFAASYTVRGAVDDPQVSVNPLAALTPGFLRGLFRLF
jgi:hypothetical protein